jgi:hypothetical protein
MSTPGDLSESVPPAPGAPRNRVQFVLLAMLFFVPLIGSFVLYFGFPNLRPSGTTNFGELVAPARPVPEQRFVALDGSPAGEEMLLGRWTYVTLGGTACDQACDDRLVMTRQLRLAMNEKRSRIQRLLVLTEPTELGTTAERLSKEHPDLKIVAEHGVAGRQFADFLEHRDAIAFLIDPNGNWLMLYPPGHDTITQFKGMQKDLKKLLSLSQIG